MYDEIAKLFIKAVAAVIVCIVIVSLLSVSAYIKLTGG